MKDFKEFMNDKFGEIRVIELDGHNWFIGKDVVKALGYKIDGSHSYTDYINKFVSDKGKVKMNNRDLRLFGLEDVGRKGETLVNEGGLNQLSLSSPLPDAQEFQEWICYEVLPILNNTGGYVVEGSEEEFIMNYFPSFSEEVKLAMVQDLLKKNKEFKDKANWYDDFMNSNGTYTSTQLAKMLNFKSAQKLNNELHENKIIYKQGKNWLPYADVNESWYKLIVGSKNDKSYSQLKFTPLGVIEISKILNIELKEENLQNI